MKPCRLLTLLTLAAAISPGGRLFAQAPDDRKMDRDVAEPVEKPRETVEFPKRPEGAIDSSKEAIAEQVVLLGHDRPDIRSAAAGRLFWIGEAARPALTEALASKDAEVAGSAGRVIGLLDALKKLTPVDTTERTAAYVMVSCSKEDKDAPGGFYQANNPPTPIAKGLKVPANTLGIILGDGSVAVWGGTHLGRQVCIFNTTPDETAFSASDSALYVTLEAKNEAGVWKSMEENPRTDCGNSYHRVFLASGEMWTFVAPVYTGKLKTKLRYKMFVSRKEKDKPVYSAEFDGAVNPEQLK